MNILFLALEHHKIANTYARAFSRFKNVKCFLPVFVLLSFSPKSRKRHLSGPLLYVHMNARKYSLTFFPWPPLGLLQLRDDIGSCGSDGTLRRLLHL